MTVPTLISITPDQGHSGGVLIEILGTGFRLLDEPAPGVPASGPTTSRVEVEFSGQGLVEVATSVAVWSDNLLYCTTPSLDPYDREVSYVAAASVFTSVAHGLKAEQIIQLSASIGGLSASVPYWPVNITDDTFQLSLSEGGAPEALTADGSGSILVDGGYTVTIRNLDNDDVAIPGEEVSLPFMFRPLRPNLSLTGHLDDVMRALMVELKRQVVRYVSWSTHTEWNEDESSIEIAFPSKLPNLVVAGLQMDENRQLGTTVQEDDNYDDVDTEGNFVTYRRPILVDIEGVLVGVADNSRVMLNLVQATKAFFRKNTVLKVPRDPNDSTVGKIEYDLRSSQTTAINLREDGSNLQWFELNFRIVGVRLEQIPGLPAKTVSGVPTSGRPTEAIVNRGKTLQVDEDDNYDGIDITTSSS